MIRLASIIEAFRDAFLAHYGERLSADQRSALEAMARCRSQASPKMLASCSACAHQQLVPHSCGHRLCPHCQHHAGEQWLARQTRALVPAGYFLLTFTLPPELRPLARARPRTVFDALMDCAWQTLRTFARNDRQLQGTPGAVAVLHTHSRRLDFHPHVHLVVPAAAIDVARRWRVKRGSKSGRGYLFNGRALAKVFRGRMLAALAAAGLRWPAGAAPRWVVHCKAVGGGEKALRYLGRYLYRGVIREADILACRDGEVTFRYRDATSGKHLRRTLPGAQFLWLVLLHVMPKGFRRARNYGFLHPNSKALIALIQVLLAAAPPPIIDAPVRAPITCPCCGAPMVIVRTRIRSHPSVDSPPDGDTVAGIAAM